MVVFPKSWTREFPLIEYQILGRSYKIFWGKKINLPARTVFVIKDGLGEIYRNPMLSVEVDKIILDKLRSDPDFFDRFYSENSILLDKIERAWNKDSCSRQELLNFIENLFNFWPAIYASIFIPQNNSFPGKVREEFLNFRKKIELVEHKAHHFINASIERLYPEVGNLAWAVSVEDLTDDKIAFQTLETRASNMIIVVDDEIVSIEKFEELKMAGDYELEPDANILDKNTLNGQSAYPGKAVGVVKIVRRELDVQKENDGDIMVSQMTLPTYSTAIKKAAAFVTDEGGITCHAAIVARELKKPCIIGTKNATKILKDGDVVEVDADKGIVTKLEPFDRAQGRS